MFFSCYLHEYNKSETTMNQCECQELLYINKFRIVWSFFRLILQSFKITRMTELLFNFLFHVFSNYFAKINTNHCTAPCYHHWVTSYDSRNRHKNCLLRHSCSSCIRVCACWLLCVRLCGTEKIFFKLIIYCITRM